MKYLEVSGALRPIYGSLGVKRLFLCHTYTDGKDKLLEWPDRSCLLLYVSARIH